MELGQVQHNYEEATEHSLDQIQPPLEKEELHQIQPRSTNLSREQIEYMKRKGLCFKCGVPGHLARNCNNNRNTGSYQSQQAKNMRRQS
jgi:hypothetical protein